MKTLVYPDVKGWEILCRRPGIAKPALDETVRNILSTVRTEGDKAIFRYSKEFDGVSPETLRVTETELKESAGQIPETLKSAISIAKENITRFHNAQIINEPVIRTFPGINCWRKNVAIEKVGLYIPGGSAPLFSTLLMLAIPARLAGCPEIIVCTPAGKDGKINPVILYTASLLGLDKIFKAGGAQAIAAMAFGTETIPKVFKIFGPGNQFVTKAKELVQMDGISIDMPAGPSEVLVIGDASANPEFIASDLLSQAEHGPDSQVVMITDDKELIETVKIEVKRQAQLLPRKDIALKALEHSKLILLSSLEECVKFSNIYAPEHLIINTAKPNELADKIVNAGSVFLGKYSCESAGDYATGTNHTLPTNGYARSYSGVSTESFMKRISFQEVSAEGIQNLGPVIEIMAEAELLQAHKNAVSIRLKNLKNG